MKTVLCFLILLCLTTAACADRVLVLYDDVPPYAEQSRTYATMLANLLGHFRMEVVRQPASEYGQATGEWRAIFYLGTVYDAPLPEALRADALLSEVPFCWIHYNLWQVAWNSETFRETFGFSYSGLTEEDYTTVGYRGETWTRPPTPLSSLSVLNTSVCEEVVTAYGQTPGGEVGSTPYIVRSGNLWYVADLPLDRPSSEGRYVVFCDVLHDILGEDHRREPQALVRIEDVNPRSDPARLRALADELAAEEIPFLISLIPVSVLEGEPPLALSESPSMLEAVRDAVDKGGVIALHGYTHEDGSTATALGFEFYGTREESLARIDLARAEMEKCRLSPVAWVTPHNAASAAAYRAIGETWDVSIGRVLIDDEIVQIFPYRVRDIHGQLVLPENVGYICLFRTDGPIRRLPPDLVRTARMNLVLHCPWASLYYHHFYGPAPLLEAVQGIKALGYQFAAPNR